MKRTELLLLACIFIVFSGCVDEVSEDAQPSKEYLELEQNEILKANFGRALAAAMTESADLRQLLKDEALKMFNRDFDILYKSIKNKVLENNLTVDGLLRKHMLHPEDIALIEQKIPLLTIFVPELPEQSFSARIWNAELQSPAVGISSRVSNDVRIIRSDLSETVLASDQIPGFPVVVVKENERVVVLNGAQNSRGAQAFEYEDTKFAFLDDCFNGSKTVNGRKRAILDQKVIDAYNIYKNVDGWQRDYIYYNISPAQPNGPFSLDFQEHITVFSLAGVSSTPGTAYSKISDQSSEPKKRSSVTSGSTPSQNAGWTGGYFEFNVKVLINSKNGLGQEYITSFGALPSDLFVLKYTKVSTFPETVWTVSIDDFRAMSLNLPLFNWDLDDYASTIKIDIEEVDVTVTTTVSETNTFKFATNFGIDITGILSKIGLKFGASLEDTKTQTTTRTFTNGNDFLGSVIVNFGDDVVLSYVKPPIGPGQATTREYQSGWFSVGVEPLRVQ